MEAFLFVDWLAWTTRYDGDVERCLPTNREGFGEGTPRRPQRPYTASKQYGPLQVCWHPGHPEFRQLHVLSGDGMAQVRQLQPDVETIAWALATGGKITRLDIAIDIVGSEVSDPYQVKQSIDMGIARATTRSVSVVDKWVGDYRAGYTVYLGARQSERMLRVYDKGAEMGVEGNITRIEIETKGSVAGLLAGEIVEDGTLRPGAREIERMCDPALPWWDSAMTYATPGQTVSVGRKKTNGEKWLYEVALPAVIDALARNDPFVVSQIWGALTSQG